MTRRTASALVVAGLATVVRRPPGAAAASTSRSADGVTAVLGPSGCGKTTLLRLVAGFLHPDAGTIVLDGATVAGAGVDVPPRRRRIGYVPQEGALFPHLDVAGNVGFGLPRAERRRGGRRVAEVLELVGPRAVVAARYPHELSGGQQQRVALARALAPRAGPGAARRAVLLPRRRRCATSTGRAVAARAAREPGRRRCSSPTTRSEALSLADQVAVMADGRFLQVGPPDGGLPRPGQPPGRLVRHRRGAGRGPRRRRAGTDAVGDALRRAPGSGRPPAGPAGRAGDPAGAAGAHPGREPGSGPTAVVEEVAFLGQHATVRAVLAGERPRVRHPGAAVDAPRPGDTVTVAVAGPVRAFPRGPRP